MKTILSIAAGAPVVFFGLSWGAMSMSPPEYTTARGLMIGAAITAAIWYFVWLLTTDEQLWIKSLIGVSIGIVALGGLPWGLDWIEKHKNSNSHRSSSIPPHPNLTLPQAQIGKLFRINPDRSEVSLRFFPETGPKKRDDALLLIVYGYKLCFGIESVNQHIAHIAIKDLLLRARNSPLSPMGKMVFQSTSLIDNHDYGLEYVNGDLLNRTGLSRAGFYSLTRLC